MGYEPENEEELIAKTEEEKNEAVRKQFAKSKKENEENKGATEVKATSQELNNLEKQAFDEFKDAAPKSKYSEKETKEMISKAIEVNKSIRYTAHKTDFTKPLENTDIDGKIYNNYRSSN